MQWHQRDPFRRPGVADEIEAQLQMQEERRLEAARVAKAETEIARLSKIVRRGIFAAGIFAAIIVFLVGVYFAGLFLPLPSKLVQHSPSPAPRSPEPVLSASPSAPVERALSPSPERSRPIASTSSRTAPVRALPAGAGPAAIEATSVSSPPSVAVPESQPASFPTARTVPVHPELFSPVGPPTLPSTTSVDMEHQIKAAFLLKFPAFVKWPPQAFSGAHAGFTIGILGADPFGDNLGNGTQGGLAIRRSRNVADLRGAQIVFISKSEGANIPGILSSFAGTNTLTVGETEGFTAQGGVIEFMQVGDKVRFKINKRAADRAGLEISNQLLRLATRVEN